MNHTYSIRVPDGALSGVSSAAMQSCLRRFFVDGGTARIAPDPGAGQVIIRRTLDSRLVEKFSASLGVSPGEALRMLAATCVHALPAPSAPVPLLESKRSLFPPKPENWSDEKSWYRLPKDYAQRIAGQVAPGPSPSSLAPVPSTVAAPAKQPDSTSQSWFDDLLTNPVFWIFGIVVLVLIFAGLAGGASAGGAAKSSGLRFPAWRPS